MPLTKQEFEDINKIYGGIRFRSLGEGAVSPEVSVKIFEIKDINLNYTFDPQTSKGWPNHGVVLYKSKNVERNHNMTFSPKPDDTIDPTKWLDLMQAEGQLLNDEWAATNAKSKDWGYNKETIEFKLKKAMLAIDVAKRYHAWGDRMYDMFKTANPKHAEFFLQAVYMSNTAKMLAWAHSDLSKMDLMELTPEQRGLWIKLMLYTIDKSIALVGIYSPEQKASHIEFSKWDYKKIRDSGFQELIDMIPPEEEEKVEQGYLGMAMSYLGSVASGFLPSFRAQQSAAQSETEKQLGVKIESLSKQLDEKLRATPDNMPIKSVNIIIDKLNELFDYIIANKIDITNNLNTNNFTTTNFSNALNYFDQVPADARIEILERAQNACDAFKECYAKSAALLKVETNTEMMARIDALYKIFTSKVGSTPQNRKKLG